MATQTNHCTKCSQILFERWKKSCWVIDIFAHNTVPEVNVTLSRPMFDSNIIVTMLSHKWTKPDHYQTLFGCCKHFYWVGKKTAVTVVRGKAWPISFLHTYLLCSSIVYSLLLSSITENKIFHKCMKKVKHEIRTKEKHNQNLIRITFVQHLFQNLVIHFNTLIQNILNPLINSRTNFIILLTVNHTVLIMLVQRI